MNSSHFLKFSCHIFSNHLNFQLLSNLKFPTLLNFEPPTPLAACLFPPWLRCRPCGVAPKGPCGHGSGSWAPSQWRSSSMPWSAAGLRSTLHPFIFYHGWGKTIYSFLKMGGSFFFLKVNVLHRILEKKTAKLQIIHQPSLRGSILTVEGHLLGWSSYHT